MDLTRTFIAVEISPAVCARAAEVIKRLQAANAKVSWVRPNNMHLTLKFLGNVPNIELVQVCRVVEEAVKGFEPFELVYRGIGAFPNREHPRTIWMGVDQGAEEIVNLQSLVDKAMKKLRFPLEPRRFQPHLTLGRVRDSGPAVAELTHLLEKYADFEGDLSIIDEVVTFSSERTRGGPQYEVIGHTTLGAPSRYSQTHGRNAEDAHEISADEFEGLDDFEGFDEQFGDDGDDDEKD
jgi:2'-5' RNA ligase